MKIKRLNEAVEKPFYIDEIVSAPGGNTDTERHSFATCDELKQYVKDMSLTKDDISNCGGCDMNVLFESYNDYRMSHDEFFVYYFGDDESLYDTLDDYDDYEAEWYQGPGYYYVIGGGDSYIENDYVSSEEEFDELCYGYLDESIEKLHTKPNGEYLVKADSGKGYTAFSRDNVAIGGINDEDAKSDDRAIEKFKKNEYSECLNEDYFDTHEFRIQKYEDDIPELMAGMHDAYMEGKLDAARYAEVLKKVYNTLADCDYKHTMSAPVDKRTPSQKALDYLDSLDESFDENSGERYYCARYAAVDNFGNKTIKKICFRCDGTIEDAEKEVDALIKEPYTDLKVFGSALKGLAIKDGYELVESCSVPVRNKATNGKRSLKESFDNVGSFSYRYVPDDIGDLPEDVLEKYTEDQIDEFITNKNIPDDLWLISEAVITCEDGWFQVSHGGWDDYREYSTVDECINDVESWYDIFEWIDDISNIEYNPPENEFDEYDDDYSDDYDESLEECSGIRAHKVVMGKDINNEFMNLDDQF